MRVFVLYVCGWLLVCVGCCCACDVLRCRVGVVVVFPLYGRASCTDVWLRGLRLYVVYAVLLRVCRVVCLCYGCVLSCVLVAVGWLCMMYCCVCCVCLF